MIMNLLRRWTHFPRTRSEPEDALSRQDEQLSAYLDGRLDPRARVMLEGAIATDPALREALDGMRSVRDALAGLPAVRAPRPFTLEAPVRARTSRFEFATRIGAVVASVGFVAALLIGQGQGSHASSTSARSTDQGPTQATASGAGFAAAPPTTAPGPRTAAPERNAPLGFQDASPAPSGGVSPAATAAASPTIGTRAPGWYWIKPAPALGGLTVLLAVVSFVQWARRRRRA